MRPSRHFEPEHRAGERGFTLIELAIVATVLTVVVFLFAGSCPGNPGGAELEAQVSWAPPLLPLKVSVDTGGALRLSVAGSVGTPVGTFSAEIRRKRPCYLAISLGPETRFYPLDQSFRVELPPNLRSKTIIEGDGKCHVSLIVRDSGPIHFAEAAPIPDGMGVLRIRSNVPRDMVALRGNGYGPTPRDLVLRPGTYDVRVMKPGCSTVTKRLIVSKAQINEVWFRLSC